MPGRGRATSRVLTADIVCTMERQSRRGCRIPGNSYAVPVVVVTIIYRRSASLVLDPHRLPVSRIGPHTAASPGLLVTVTWSRGPSNVSLQYVAFRSIQQPILLIVFVSVFFQYYHPRSPCSAELDPCFRVPLSLWAGLEFGSKRDGVQNGDINSRNIES